MEQLSSKENSIIKSCKALAESASERRKQGLIFLEGMRLCGEAARAGVRIETLLCTEEALGKWQTQLLPLREQAAYSAVITPQLGKHISQTQTAQGVYCICAMPESTPPDMRAGGSFLLLDRLQDPGNMGSIIRTAEAFGTHCIILSQDCVDIWSPKVLRSTMGSCFRQQIWITDNLPQTAKELAENGVTVYGAALDPQAVTPAELSKGSSGIAIVIGNEGNGISPQVLECCSHCLYIPMTAEIESLNAATAAAVLLWELSKLP